MNVPSGCKDIYCSENIIWILKNSNGRIDQDVCIDIALIAWQKWITPKGSPIAHQVCDFYIYVIDCGRFCNRYTSRIMGEAWRSHNLQRSIWMLQRRDTVGGRLSCNTQSSRRGKRWIISWCDLIHSLLEKDDIRWWDRYAGGALIPFPDSSGMLWVSGWTYNMRTEVLFFQVCSEQWVLIWFANDFKPLWVLDRRPLSLQKHILVFAVMLQFARSLSYNARFTIIPFSTTTGNKCSPTYRATNIRYCNSV